ncbi:MAG: PilZ domain-containing protein [Nitrospirae bacterium]|nr:PilZ domain-containing protein [Nitrospirota bacterium]
MTNADKRRYKRYDVNNMSGQIMYSVDARILNMSIDGMAVETHHIVNVDRKYQIKLSNGVEAVELKGVVVWSKLVRTERLSTGDVVPVFKAGIKFENLLTDKAKKLLEFIDKNRILKLEHRLHGRFRIDSKTAKIGSPHDYQIKKISLSGMLIESDTMLDPGLELEFILNLNKNRQIKTRGRVVNIKKDDSRNTYLMGIEFIDLSDKDKAILRDYLSRNC